MITCENIYKFRDYLLTINNQPQLDILLNTNNDELKEYIAQEYYSDDRKISITVKDEKDIDYVIQSILNKIKSYYLDNYYVCNVPVEEAEDFVNYLNNPSLYGDVYNIGKTIEFQL